MSDNKSESLVPRSDSPRKVPRLRPSQRSLVANDQEFSLRFLVNVLVQWWKVLVPVTLLLWTISAGLVFFFFEPKYRASAWLQIKGHQPYVAYPDEEPADRDSNKKYVHTQIELLRSPLILGRALSHPDIANLPELKDQRDPADWLARNGLEITPKGDSELLEVAYAGSDPQASAQLVNAVVNAYFSVRDEKSGAQIQSIILLLENERTRRADEIRMLQTEIRQLQAQLVQRDPTRVHETLQANDIVISENPLKEVQQNLVQAEIERKILEAQATALESSLEAKLEIPAILVDREVNQRKEIQEVEQQLSEKRATLQQIARVSVQANSDPRYVRMEQEVKQLEQHLASLRDVNRPQVRGEMEAIANVERHRQLEALRTQLTTQQLVVQNMQSNYDRLVKDLSVSGGQSLDLRLKQRELERRQEVFDRISDRAAQLATEAYAPRRVEPIQNATPPAVPMESIPWKLLLIVSACSLSMPLGFCLLWERSMRRVTSVEQLQYELSVPVLGEIARLPVRQGGHAISADSLQYELGMFEESVDSLRTGLVLAHDHEKIQVLTVSSAVSGEGKSSVASQLAVSLARASGLPTLLIDGDMRAPDLHRIFQISLEPGLADVLAGKEKISGCINRTWSEHVHILPAGKLCKSPHKLIGGDRFQAVLDWARRHYPFIIVDTPPVLAASEAMVMARQSDATLICAMRDVSRETHVRMTFDRLIAVGARPIGTVLSGVPTRQYARRYGSYSYKPS